MRLRIVGRLRAIQREVDMPAQRLRDFLDSQGVKYVSIKHSLAYTAQEIAASAHIPGKEVAKTVVVHLDDKVAMVIQPATAYVHLGRLKEQTGARMVTLAKEMGLEDMFPDCELGAMPPFGNLYDMPVYVGEELTEDEEIAFNAGTHTELIKLKYQDFENLVHPMVVHV